MSSSHLDGRGLDAEPAPGRDTGCLRQHAGLRCPGAGESIDHECERDLVDAVFDLDADTLVPLDQSQRFIARAEELGLGERIELVIRPGRSHGWITMFWDVRQFAQWFEEQLVSDSR